MSAITEIVTLTISVNSVGIARLGFGVPMILSANAGFYGAARIRYYTSTLGVAGDWATNTPEYLAAAAAFAQSPHPTQVAIGRAALQPTMQYTIDGSVGVQNSHLYSINVGGQSGITAGTASYTSDSTATTQKINNGLLTALNAITGKNYLAAFAALGSLAAQNFTVASQAQGQLTITGHGLNTGDGPVQLTTTGTLPTGLSTLTNYWVIKVDANTIQLATSLANALALTFIVLSSNGSGTNTETPTGGALSPILPFTVTGNAAGNWFALEVVNPAVDLKVKESHADPGVATDLAAILVADQGWYGLVTLYNSKAYVLAAAAWVESNVGLYIPDVCESDAFNTTVLNGDTVDALNSLTYNHTGAVYHPRPAEFIAAAWLGNVLPLTPGQDDWMFKTLAGVSAITISATGRTNLKAKNANFYYQVAGRSIMTQGTVAGGNFKFIDVTRSLDFLQNDMESGVFGALAGATKTPYTNNGISVIENEVRAALKRATANGILSPDFPPVITVPTAQSLAGSSNKALRILPNVNFTATLAGAIHTVQINGTVSF